MSGDINEEVTNKKQWRERERLSREILA